MAAYVAGSGVMKDDFRILDSLVVTKAGMLASTAMPLGPYSAARDTDRWSTYALVAP